MLTIAAKTDGAQGLRLLLSGKMNANGLGELRREIDEARRLNKQVVLDLSEVTLVDRQSVEFLGDQSNGRVLLENCPCYLEPWIGRPVSA